MIMPFRHPFSALAPKKYATITKKSIQKIFDLNRGLEYGALFAASDCALFSTKGFRCQVSGFRLNVGASAKRLCLWRLHNTMLVN